ncbi:biopolymer transporter ExbD [Chryseobacterium sp. Ch-15]|uniref:Biopolymer transporter ExbD n=1 Tax=Chryseobacterium muglaense TaxID=2893752 RepID=A0A9Q3UZ62_9FLAO|nr:biopolymer transporter ExbD [Chryseobacterium muglaense]MBD3904641.1 biopolymer transporter ExbD [Chryseobacterium muglaense]MCC9035645.1 biopolymer transporter ExbD [Chryseobacterium muglaense]MCM2555173.1 biopolymer transporter ExbD [Chryseobacterium muglaense]
MAEVIIKEKSGGKQNKKPIKIDMTPMVDLNFLLLMFFMFTSSFTKPNVMDLGLPGKNTVYEPHNVIDYRNQITFIIGENNRIFYHQSSKEDLTEAGLKETDYNGLNVSKIISNAYEKAPRKEIFTIIVKPTDDANYKNFVDMMDNISISKKERYGISDIKPWEKKVYENLIK